jgi:hypothetical protein
MIITACNYALEYIKVNYALADQALASAINIYIVGNSNTYALRSEVAFMEKELMWLIGALVVFVLVINVVIPTAISSASNFNAAGTATGEQWNGTASAVHTMTYLPLVSVTDFRLSTVTSQYNDSAIAGNSSVNTTSSRYFTLSNLDTGTVSGKLLNVTVVSTVAAAGANYTIYYNGARLGTVSASGTDTWNSLTPASSVNITIVRAGENATTISNVTVRYNYFATNTNYTVTSTSAAQLTPTVTGTFYTTYTYGTGVTGGTLAVVLILPLMIAVVVFLLFIKSAGVF